MATVAAIFDDSVALERAVGKLNDAGLGDDIVQVSENRDADTAPEQTETPAEPTGENVGSVGSVGLPVAAGAGGLLGLGGSGGNQGAAALVSGNVFGGGGDGLGRLDRLGDAAEPFRLAAERGGKLIMLETSDVETAVSTLQAAGAQQVYDPR